MVEVSTSTLDIEEENAVKTFYNIETAKTDYFHIDAMDGKFVDNNNLEKMKKYALEIHTVSRTPLDVHLMVQNPKSVIDDFIDYGADRITFHLEVCRDKEEALDIIKYLIENGVKVGLAINPDTEVEKVYEFLPYIHMVLIMTVVPGKGGQKLIPETLEKIRNLREYCDKNDIDLDIEVDGGINDVTAKDVINSGANILVSGKYILTSENCAEAIKKLKEE